MVRSHSLQITADMLSRVAEIDEFKGAWTALGRLAPDRLVRLRTIATIESVGASTRIEGSALSDREVETLLARAPDGSFATRDEQEVAGYAAVMDTIFANFDSIPITENYVKQLHAMLLTYSIKDARHRGEYKKVPVSIEAFDEQGHSLGVVFDTSSPFDTPRDMAELIAWYHLTSDAKKLHPILTVGMFVVVFLAIHPFQDGNGRLSHILTSLLLLKSGYGYIPYASLESVIEQNKDTYYLALRRTQITLKNDAPDWSPWLDFFLRSLHEQKRRLEAKVGREHLMRASLPDLAVRILDLAAQHGQISVAQIILATGAPRGTVKKRLTDLVEQGQLKRTGQARSTRYVIA